MRRSFDPVFFPEECKPFVQLKDLIPAHFQRERDNCLLGGLMDAVILQATEDYRAACSLLRVNPKSEKGLCMKKDVERFLLGEMCQLYTDVPGGMILEKLQKEQEEIVWKSGKHMNSRMSW